MRAMRSNAIGLVALAGVLIGLKPGDAQAVDGDKAYAEAATAVERGNFAEAGKQFDVYLACCSENDPEDPHIPFALVSGMACHLLKPNMNDEKARQYARRLLTEFSVPGSRAGVKAREGFLAMLENKHQEAALSFGETARLIGHEKPTARMVKRLGEARLWRCICLSLTGKAGLQDAFEDADSILRNTDPAERIHQEAIYVMGLLRAMPASKEIPEISTAWVDEECMIDMRRAALGAVDDLIQGPCRLKGLIANLNPVDVFLDKAESDWGEGGRPYRQSGEPFEREGPREMEQREEVSAAETEFRQAELLLQNGEFAKAQVSLFEYVKANQDRSYGWIGRRGQALAYLMSCALKEPKDGRETARYYARELLETLLVSEAMDRGGAFQAFDALVRGRPFEAARVFGRLADERRRQCAEYVDKEALEEIMLWKAVCMVCMKNEYALKEAYDVIDAMLLDMGSGGELRRLAAYVGACAAAWAGNAAKMDGYLAQTDGTLGCDVGPLIARSMDELLAPRISVQVLFEKRSNAIGYFLEEMDQEIHRLRRRESQAESPLGQ